MNKKYIIKEDGEVIVITDKGDTEVREYTENTDEILSLENSAESISTTIRLLERRYNELNNKVRVQKRDARIFNIVLSLCYSLIIVLGAMISVELLVSILLMSIPTALVTGLIEKIIINKNIKKREECNKLLIQKQKVLDKINSKIKNLSLDKTKKETKQTNQVIEVKRIIDYRFTPEDYFIRNYQVDKRTREMTQGSKKLTRKKKIQ